MTAYRAYRLDKRRRIYAGTWLEAPDDAAAREQASELCDEESPAVELWQSARLVDEIDCEDED